jgi:RimJ/RimL family protein N-acetyltransferase
VTSQGMGLRRIERTDWTRIHEWARNPKASVFQPWGPNSRLRHTKQLADGWRDSDMFSILRGEWTEPDGAARHSGRG